MLWCWLLWLITRKLLVIISFQSEIMIHKMIIHDILSWVLISLAAGFATGYFFFAWFAPVRRLSKKNQLLPETADNEHDPCCNWLQLLFTTIKFQILRFRWNYTSYRVRQTRRNFWFIFACMKSWSKMDGSRRPNRSTVGSELLCPWCCEFIYNNKFLEFTKWVLWTW